MKSIRTLAAVLLVTMLLVGCYTIQYDIGKGAQGNQTLKARQWYVLWGLVPINSPDVAGMIGNAENYTYKSQQEPLDIIIGCITGSVSVYCQTVTIKKQRPRLNASA